MQNKTIIDKIALLFVTISDGNKVIAVKTVDISLGQNQIKNDIAIPIVIPEQFENCKIELNLVNNKTEFKIYQMPIVIKGGAIRKS